MDNLNRVLASNGTMTVPAEMKIGKGEKMTVLLTKE